MNIITQLSHKIKRFIPEDCQPIPAIRSNPIEELEKISPNYLRVFNIINWYSRFHSRVIISQQLIATKLGICTRTVKRALIVLRRLGLLATLQRFNDTLVYRVSSFFHDFWMRKRLQHLIPSLFWNSLLLLFSPILAFNNTSNEVSQYNIKENKLFMCAAIFNELSTNYRMTPEQTRLLLSYPAHIVEYADQELRKKGSVVDTWSRDYRNLVLHEYL